MIRTGIFGGSFNPIHKGHISLAQELRKRAGLDEVWLMVSPQNPLKQQTDLLDDTLRMKMARLALKDVDTWNTLQHLSADYPDREFVLIVGGDNWAHFQRWRHWKDILWHHRIIAYPREQYTGTIDVPLLNVSSTEIRERVRQGLSIDGLVPTAIVKLVQTYY